MRERRVFELEPAILVAVALQAVGALWWASQAAARIEALEDQVSQCTTLSEKS